MINVPKNLEIATDETPLRYNRVYGFGADTFYFRCPQAHLGKYNLPVSTFQGFEGTVKEKLRCYRKGCDFNDNIWLQNWLFQG